MKNSATSNSPNVYIRRIMELCEQRGWTINRLASEAKVPQSTLSGLSSKDNAPTIPTLAKLCVAFNITLSEFFADGGGMVELTEEQRRLLDAWAAAPEAKREIIWNILNTL